MRFVNTFEFLLSSLLVGISAKLVRVIRLGKKSIPRFDFALGCGSGNAQYCVIVIDHSMDDAWEGLMNLGAAAASVRVEPRKSGAHQNVPAVGSSEWLDGVPHRLRMPVPMMAALTPSSVIALFVSFTVAGVTTAGTCDGWFYEPSHRVGACEAETAHGETPRRLSRFNRLTGMDQGCTHTGVVSVLLIS